MRCGMQCFTSKSILLPKNNDLVILYQLLLVLINIYENISATLLTLTYILLLQFELFLATWLATYLPWVLLSFRFLLCFGNRLLGHRSYLLIQILSHLLKHIVHIDITLSTSLIKRSSYFGSQTGSFLLGDCSLGLEVTFGSNYSHYDSFVGKVSNILKPTLDILKRMSIIDGISLNKYNIYQKNSLCALVDGTG